MLCTTLLDGLQSNSGLYGLVMSVCLLSSFGYFWQSSAFKFLILLSNLVLRGFLFWIKRSKVKVIMGKYGYNLMNMLESKLSCTDSDQIWYTCCLWHFMPIIFMTHWSFSVILSSHIGNLSQVRVNLHQSWPTDHLIGIGCYDEMVNPIFSEPGRMVSTSASTSALDAWRKTLTLAITFLPEVIGLSYCTCEFLMTRPFTWYHNFLSLDLDLEVWPTFENFKLVLYLVIVCRPASVVVFWQFLLVSQDK